MLYFAYGSNLDIGQMRFRCPGARALHPLRLLGYRLIFRGPADIEPRKGGEVFGGLWRVTRQDERNLDTYEGVHRGLYRKCFVKYEGQPVLVYRMNRTGYQAPLLPYVNIIRQGYEDFGLPLESLETALRAFEPHLIRDPFAEVGGVG